MVFSHQSETTTRHRQDNDKANVEPVHSYDAFHARFVGPGVKGIIGMHRFNICLVVLLSCSGVKTPLRPQLKVGGDGGRVRGGETGISGVHRGFPWFIGA